jgi:hypothetical protein
MEPIVKAVEKKLNKRILRFNVGKKRNAELLECLDSKNQCSGLPYFYNRKTHDFICGATTFSNLFNWATNAPFDPFETGADLSEEYEREVAEERKLTYSRVTGFGARYQKMLKRRMLALKGKSREVRE